MMTNRPPQTARSEVMLINVYDALMHFTFERLFGGVDEVQHKAKQLSISTKLFLNALTILLRRGVWGGSHIITWNDCYGYMELENQL